MSTFVAWRMLVHEKGRNLLAVAGIFIAVLMIFLQLGFYSSVPKGGLQVYNHLRFDLLMTSSSYVVQTLPFDFPRQRLYQVLSLPQVESAVPLYQGIASWLSPEDGARREIFMMGIRPGDPVFEAPDIERQMDVLRRPDTVLVDTSTKAIFGPLTPGRIVEIANRKVEIGGQYVLGVGFTGLGAMVASDVNFIRILPYRSLATVNLGFIRLKPGSNPDAVATQIRQMLPADTQVLTRAELDAREADQWQSRTATGIVFGFGVIVAIIVGIVIVYQTLATQVTRQLPQYATLKAMGYTDSYLLRIVVALAAIMAGLAFALAFVAAIAIYARVRTLTPLPVEMTVARAISVLALSFAMSAASAVLAVRILRRADPADLFF
jgi:putative ABC transport system permease protein